MIFSPLGNSQSNFGVVPLTSSGLYLQVVRVVIDDAAIRVGGEIDGRCVEGRLAKYPGARQRLVARSPLLRWRLRNAVAVLEAAERRDAKANEPQAEQRSLHAVEESKGTPAEAQQEIQSN